MARREYKGAAVPTRLTTGIGISDTAFTLNANTGWPTGGANGNFFVTLDPETPNEERVLVGAQAAGVCSSVLRGQDNTSAKTHAVGIDGSVIHSSAAVDYDEANRHINVTTDDNHLQYMRTDGVRHDLTARHPGGTVVPTAIPVAIGTGLAEGAGTNLARSTHVHTIGAGAINSSGMFTAGIVNLAAIGTAAVGSDELVNDSVINTKIADAAIDDENFFSTGLSPIIVSATNPGAVGANRIWFNTTAAKLALLRRNAGDTAWEVVSAFGPGINYTPTLTNFSVGAGSNVARYTRQGRTIVVHGWIKMGTGATTDANPFFVSLPVNAVDTTHAEFFFHGAARGFDLPGGGAYAAVGLVRGGTSNAGGTDFDRIGIFATAGSPAWNNVTPFTWNGPSQDGFSWFATYEAASAEDLNFV